MTASAAEAMCSKLIHIITTYGRRQKKFPYHNRKMVQLQLCSDMNYDFVDKSQGQITVLKQRNYGHPRSNYASDMHGN